jgi:tripartite-type tricarboxylate transporter receptor subunit TctC
MRRRAMMFLAGTLWPAVLLSATMLLLPAPAWPQGYPERPIKLVVPFPAGGPSDFFSRI